jgi:hypothetical protein
MTATIPDLFGFETYYGLKLSDIGEDGAVIILGHHDDPRPVIAALNKHSRTFWGLVNLMDDRSAELAELASMFSETYAVARHNEACRDEACADCALVRAGQRAWWINWDVPPERQHAFPVTVWNP